MTFASKLTLLGGLASTAIAHGTVTGFVTDGTYNGGFLLDYYYMEQNGQTPPDTAGWYAENLDNGFVEPNSFNTPDIICHKNAKPATSSATVAAGGTVEFQWSEWPDSHMGPVITYVAACDGDCAEADKEALQWVKIDEAGLEGGEWASVTMIGNNNTYAATVPETLAPGNYVFRNEIIALHGAGEVNGAQAYPQCMNIEITGSGTDQPEGVLGTELYTAEDPGIHFDPYSGAEEYPIPGPPLYGSGTTPPTPGEPLPPVNSTIPVPSGTGLPTGTGSLPEPTGIETEPSFPEPSASDSAAPSGSEGGSEPTGAPEFPTFPELPGDDASSGDASSAPEPTGLPEIPTAPGFPSEPEPTASEPDASAAPSDFPEPSGAPGFPSEPELPSSEPELPAPSDFPSEPELPTDPPSNGGGGGHFPSLPETFTLESLCEFLKQLAGGSTPRRHARDVQY